MAASLAPSICDAATVPAAKAEAVNKWARRLLESPAPDEAHNSLELRCSAALNLHLVSRKSFASGEIVLSEQPILRTGQADPKLAESLAKRYGRHISEFIEPALGVDWDRVTQEECEAALNLFWVHPLIRERSYSDGHLDACKDFVEQTPSVKRHMDGENLMKFLHIVDLNIHKDEDAGDPTHFGIFVLGSKLTHSCAPNCNWSFGTSGALQYRALKPIVAGEVLTFSYIGNSFLLASTIARRRRLSSLWFCCSCDRCLAPDLSRQLPCPSCGAERCMPVYSLAASDNWRGDRPLKALIEDAEEWRCAACSASVASSRMPLQAEAKFEQIVPEVMQWSFEQTTVDDADATYKLRVDTEKLLGTMHWLWSMFTFAWLQKWLLLSKKESVLPFLRICSLKEASVALAQRFEEIAADNIEQRLTGLFLAARLAHHFGGSLESWGYDSKDPLHDDEAATRLMLSSGWKLNGEVVSPEEEQLWRRVSDQPQRRIPQPQRSRSHFCGVWR